MTLQFRKLSSTTVRETIAQGLLPDLEFGLLKKYGKELNWTTADKAIFADLAIDILECQQDHLKLKVIVRSFCYSRDVTTDYLSLDERFNMKRCVLVVGDNGMQPAPWAGLIQPAVYLHAHEFNVLCIEIPEYATNTQRWIKYGPSIMRGALRFLCVDSVSVLACGNGGAIFLEALGQSRKVFGRTHFVYNIDCPPGTRKAQFPVFQLEEHLRESDLQLWFGYNDEEDNYNRYVDGTPRKSFEAISGMQARLEGERKRGKRGQEYDEVLITERLNEKDINAERLVVGKNTLFVFSEGLLKSIARFFEHSPSTKIEEMQDGLVADPNALCLAKFQDVPELPALAALPEGIGTHLEHFDTLTLSGSRRFDMMQGPQAMQAIMGTSGAMHQSMQATLLPGMLPQGPWLPSSVTSQVMRLPSPPGHQNQLQAIASSAGFQQAIVPAGSQPGSRAPSTLVSGRQRLLPDLSRAASSPQLAKPVTPSVVNRRQPKAEKKNKSLNGPASPGYLKERGDFWNSVTGEE